MVTLSSLSAHPLCLRRQAYFLEFYLLAAETFAFQLNCEFGDWSMVVFLPLTAN